jgi:peptide deformylase
VRAMARRKVLLFPDKRLRVKARPVEKVDAAIRRLIDDLAETMYSEPGVGLAAPQVGVPYRVFVIDTASPEGGELRAFVNPRIVATEGEVVWKEGCLSFPGISEEVDRFKKVRVEALDRDGKPFSLEATELLGVAIQHENDHLDGKLLVDHVSFLKKRMIRREMAKLHAERGEKAEPEGE